eukprot:3349280-Pleurochrysis_carterae.AAC.1
MHAPFAWTCMRPLHQLLRPPRPQVPNVFVNNSGRLGTVVASDRCKPVPLRTLLRRRRGRTHLRER